MFCVVYKFDVKPGCEQEFVDSWRAGTEEIKAQRGGLGSRLHKSSSGEWIAYAQWPNRQTWADPGGPPSAAGQRMRECLTRPAETVLELDVVADLLEYGPKLS